LNNYVQYKNVRRIYILYRIEIIFKDDHTDTRILEFFDTATNLWINDKVDGKYGARARQQYPFSNFKTYTILFEALDTQWKVELSFHRKNGVYYLIYLVC
jgi:hypothetical protein